MKIKKINVFKTDKVFEAVINKNESYFIELSKGREGLRYDAVFKIAQKMNKINASNPERRKMSGYTLFQNENDGDEKYKKFYRCWLEFTNKMEYINDYPFKLIHKISNNRSVVRNDDTGKNKKKVFADSFFQKNKEKTNIEDSLFWLGDEANTEVKIIPQSVENYYKINDEPWIIKYKNRLSDELTAEEEIQDGRFIELDITRKEEEQTSNPPTPEKFLDIAKDNQILILLGEAGSGKTTTLRQYFHDCLSNLDENSPGQIIPIFIKLKRFKEHEIKPLEKTLSNLIITTLNNKLDNSSEIEADEINLKNDFVILFDGLDEITESGSYNAAIEQLQDLFSKINNNGNSKVIISCRTRDYHNNFNQYSSYELKELEDYQIKNYLSDFLNRDIDINVIFEKQIMHNQGILEMARIPFLLHIMACIIEKNLKENSGDLQSQLLTQNKGALIKQFVEDICSDESKKTVNTIDVTPTQKYRLLSMLAFDMLNSGDRGEYTCPAKIRNKVEEEYFKVTGTTVKQTTDMLQKAEKERLLKSGSAYGEIEFIHSLVRDYFAAYYLSQLSQNELLILLKEDLLEYMKWDETISLLVGIVDEKTSNKIMQTIINIDPYLAAICFPKSQDPNVDTETSLINILGNNIIKYTEGHICKLTATAFNNMRSHRIKDYIIRLMKKNNEKDNLQAIASVISSTDTTVAIINLVHLMEKIEEHADLLEVGHALIEMRFDDAVDYLNNFMQINKNCKFQYDVVQVLVHIKTEYSVDILINLMEKSKCDFDIRTMAIYLGLTGSEKPIEPLLNLAKRNKTGKFTDTIISALSSIRTEKAEMSIVKIIENFRTQESFDSVELCLQNISSEKAIDYLIKLLKRSKNKVLIKNIELVLDSIISKKPKSPQVKLQKGCKDNSIIDNNTIDLDNSKNEELQMDYIRMLAEESNNSAIKNILSKLESVATDNVIKPLIALTISCKSIDVIESIVGVFEKIGSKMAVKALIDLVTNNKDYGLFFKVVQALGGIRSEEALIKLIKKCNGSFHLSSITFELGNMCSGKAENILLTLIESCNDNHLLGNVVFALGEIRSDKAVIPLLKLIESNNDESILSSAAFAISKIRPKNIVSALIKLMERTNSKCVVQDISRILGGIGSEKDLKPLVGLVERIRPSDINEYSTLPLHKIKRIYAYDAIEMIKEDTGRRYLKQLKGFS